MQVARPHQEYLNFEDMSGQDHHRPSTFLSRCDQTVPQWIKTLGESCATWADFHDALRAKVCTPRFRHRLESLLSKAREKQNIRRTQTDESWKRIRTAATIVRRVTKGRRRYLTGLVTRRLREPEDADLREIPTIERESFSSQSLTIIDEETHDWSEGWTIYSTTNYFGEKETYGRDITRFIETLAGRARLAWIAGISGEQMAEFATRGTINLPLFKWWNQSHLHALAKLEFDMYRWHLGEVNDSPNLSCLRNMFFSITQQLMRQDLRYWAAHVLLRRDHAWKLVSYPHHTEFALAGDDNRFRRLDLNIIQLLNLGRRDDQELGRSRLRGSLSIDDERPEDCTEVVPGMHQRHVRALWCERLALRGVCLRRYLHRITSDLLSTEDLSDFNTQWEAVPCEALSVRITEPSLPYGSRGPAVGVRRTMEPEFMAMRDRCEDVEEMSVGSLANVIRDHRSLKPLRSHDVRAELCRGLPAEEQVVARAPAVRVDGINALSDAMVASRNYNSSEVLAYVRNLLYAPKEIVEDELARFEREAAQLAQRSFKNMEAMERETMGEKSYFKWLDGHGGIVFPPTN